MGSKRYDGTREGFSEKRQRRCMAGCGGRSEEEGGSGGRGRHSMTERWLGGGLGGSMGVRETRGTTK